LDKTPLSQQENYDILCDKYFNDFHLHIYKRGEIIFNQLDKKISGGLGTDYLGM